MRASHLKENVTALCTLGPGPEARIRDRQRENIASITRAARMEWLDVRLDVELTEAIAYEAGLAAVLQLNSDAIARTIDGPLLRPLVEGAFKLFGVTPSSLLRWSGHAYRQIYQECGEISVNEACTVITLRGLPARLRGSTPWLEGVAGALHGTVRVCGAAPRVSCALSPVDATRVDFSVAYG